MWTWVSSLAPAVASLKEFDRPVEVRGLVGVAQREQLAQGGLVHLDDADAGRLEVGDLLAEGEGDLVGGDAERLVVANEGPREDRHGTGEHALDGLVDSDWAYSAQRTVIGSGRATSPHRIDGRVQREPYDCTQPLTVTSKPSSSSAKYWTMSLRSASPWTRTSRPEVLLQLHDGGDLGLHRGLVVGVAQLALGPRGASLADLGGLGEGADGRGRELGKVEAGLLSGDALGVGRTRRSRRA